MTVIRHNSISGIVSITAAAGSNLSFYDSAGATLSLDTGNINAGVITATTANFTNATVTGDLTVQGTTTTLDTTVTEVDKLEVGANNTTVGVAITQSGTGDILRLYDGASQVVTVADGGNIGIGTESPDASFKVTVEGRRSAVTPGIYFKDTDASPVNYALYLNGSKNFVIRDQTNTTDRLTIDSSGRLLVGTNSAVGGGSVGELLQVGFSGGARAILANTSTSLANGALLGQIDFNTNVGSSISTGANIKANCDGTAGSGDAPTRLTFWTTADSASSPTERMRISANGDISIDSNAFYFDAVNNRFGVGTASPGAPLDVVGGSTQALFQGGTNSNGLIRIRPNGTAVYSAVYFDNAAGTSTAGITCAYGANFYIDSASNGDIYHRTNGTGSHVWTVNSGALEAARIDSSGRLLVGTSSSSSDARIHLRGRPSDANNGARIHLCREGASPNSGDNLGVLDFGNQQGTSGAFLSGWADANWSSGTSHPTRLVFSTTASGASSPTERMRITSAGYVSIGGAVTSPTNPLVINRYGDGNFSPSSATELVSKAGLLVNPDSNNSSAIFSVAKHSVGVTLLQASNGSGSSVYNLVACPFGDSFLVGTTAAPSSSNTGVQITTGSFPRLVIATGDATSNQLVQFINTNGQVGNISTSGSSTQYNTSSDHRLKENVVDLGGAIDRVKQLAPKRFNFIADAETTVDGFLAHEAAAVVPEAVTGTQDEVDDDGNPVYQGIDQSKLVPLLTAALKEAIGEIETLKARLDAAGL